MISTSSLSAFSMPGSLTGSLATTARNAVSQIAGTSSASPLTAAATVSAGLSAATKATLDTSAGPTTHSGFHSHRGSKLDLSI